VDTSLGHIEKLYAILLAVDSKRKVAEENANFVAGLDELFEAMIEMLPEEQQELHREALKELQPQMEQTEAELRSGKHDEALAQRKPPALWELEKQGYNEAAKEAGLPPIEEADE
jgi:hypothetical protein